MSLECEHGQLARSCNICEYEREIAELRARVAELEAWKESALAIENLWDVQAVGREIGVDLGEPIRSQILPYIKRLKAALAEREAVLKWLANEACQECGADAGDTCNCVTCMTETAKAALAGKEAGNVNNDL